jgi:DNA topoisomerase I
VLAAVELATNGHGANTQTARKRAAAAATSGFADYLSNTPAVCRASYIDPRVFDRFDSGETIRASLDRIVSGSPPDKFPDRARIERAVPRLLE